MKKQLLLLGFLPLMAFAVVNDWIKVNLDNRVSIEFPTKPVENEMQGNAVWVGENGTNSRCMAMILDFEKFGMDSTMLATEMAKPESFEQFRDGITAQIEGSTVISEKSSTINGFTTFEYVIDMGKKDTATLNKMYNRNVFIGSKMYSISFYEKDGRPMEADRKKFFESFKVK